MAYLVSHTANFDHSIFSFEEDNVYFSPYQSPFVFKKLPKDLPCFHIKKKSGHYFVNHSQSFSSLLINDQPCKSHVLKNGDRIQLDFFTFTFFSEEKELLELNDSQILLCDSESFSIIDTEKTENNTSLNELSAVDPSLTPLFAFDKIKDFETLSMELHQKIKTLFPQSRVFLFVWDKIEKKFQKKLEVFPKHPEQSESIRISKTVLALLLKEKKPLLIQDILRDLRFKKSQSLHGQSVHSIMTLPLKTQQGLLGIFYFDSLHNSYNFNQDDFIVAQQISTQLTWILEKLFQNEKLKKENRQLKRQIQEQFGFIGLSHSIKKTLSIVERVAITDLSVLIRGETGTGKELLAKMIHSISPRSSNSFISVHCAAVSESLFESEVFGHEKGAFTGADTNKPGLIELADNGTLFFDEIGDIPLSIQVKLLRFLEERKIRRVGGTKLIPINCRILSATNSDLEKDIEKNIFRSDLYYRLKGIQIDIPPLRDRTSDIKDLSQYFINLFKEKYNDHSSLQYLSPSAIEKAIRYDWPGNVRELKQRIEQAMVICDQQQIEPQYLFPELENKKNLDPSKIEQHELIFKLAHKKFEEDYFKRLMVQTKGNVSQASRLSGLERSFLHHRLKKIGVKPGGYRKSE